jgi:hypothetical protein
MKYRYFEETFGTRGVRIAVENKLLSPFTYRDIRDENGESIYEGKMQGGSIDDVCGEGFYLGNKLVILTGSVKENRYFELTDDTERPYIDQKLREELPSELQGIPLLIIIHDYPGLTQIEAKALLEQHIT